MDTRRHCDRDSCRSSATFFWFCGIQAVFAYQAHDTARKLPFVKNVPVELTALSASQVPRSKLSYFGYEFEVPWRDVDQERTKLIGSSKAVVAFRNGNALYIWSGQPHEFVNGVMQAMKVNRQEFSVLYGDKPLESDYEFKQAVLEVTPDKCKCCLQSGLQSVRALC